MGRMIAVQTTVEPIPKRLCDGAVLSDCMPRGISEIFVDGESMFLLEARLQARQFLATRHPSDFEESPAAALEEVASMDVLVGDLEGECDWDWDAFMRVPDLSSRTGICGAYGLVLEACSVVNDSVLPPVVDLLSLAVSNVEEMSRVSIQEVRICDLESTFSSNNKRIGNLESQFASNKSERNVTTVELEYTERLSRLAGDAFILMPEQVQYKASQL